LQNSIKLRNARASRANVPGRTILPRFDQDGEARTAAAARAVLTERLPPLLAQGKGDRAAE
jgi:hypothetical protein